MTKAVLFYLIPVFFPFISHNELPRSIRESVRHSFVIQENPSDKSLLLNGRIWHNQYSKVTGDQFFLGNIFFKGSVTFDGRKFDNLDLKYDIYNDDLILSIESYPVIMVNKEMVDSFSLVVGKRIIHIINAGSDTSNVVRGYVNVLYNGPSSLYAKYTKKIQPLGDDGKYDLFVEEHLVYLRKGTEMVRVDGKRKLFNLLDDKKKEVREYLKSNRLKVRQKDPGTFIPLLEYYDSLRK
jgi:hypothetical protein